MPNGAHHWVFTLNNYTSEEYDGICTSLSDQTIASYAVIGREIGEEGTPHLQGFVCFSNRKTMRAAKQILGDRVHLEMRRGTAKQAADYCKKEKDFVEYGTPPSTGGGCQWKTFVTWLKSRDKRPSDGDLLDEFPHLMARYSRGCLMLRNHHHPLRCPRLPNDLREWQQDLVQHLSTEPDDRTVVFVVDEEGNQGKSYLVRKLVSERSDVQKLPVAKRDDMALTLDPTKSIFLMDVPRGQMEYFQYSICEMIKDCMVSSPKYDSCMKFLDHYSHVVVFSNEYPDMGKLSQDRYKIIAL